jgi:hypothetical protein
MAKSKKLSGVKGFLGANLFTLALVFLAAGSVFVYDRTIWIASAQSVASGSPSSVVACSNTTNGNLRAVNSLDQCKNGEKGLMLQGAIPNLLSDVEVVWYQPPGDRNTNFEGGINVKCPEGKVVIGGGSTEVVRQNTPKDETISGGSGQTGSPVEEWSIVPWRYEAAPVVYAICAKVNK